MQNLSIVSEVQLRYKSKVKASKRIRVTDSKEAYKVLKSIAEFNENIEYKEMFYLMLLSINNKILSVIKISEGGTSGSIVDIKILMQAALLQNAIGIIISHNHPSGNTQPSKQDIETTREIEKACGFFKIKLHDHLIITDESYYSFADQGML